MNIQNANHGFTLVEVMAVAAIIAILATVAYPSYVEHMGTSRRTDGQGALLGFAAAMERYYTANGTYLGAAQGQADTGTPDSTVYSATAPVGGSGAATYNLSITAATATSYTLAATPTGAQANDKCGTLTVNQLGVGGIQNAKTGMTVADCWRR